ncbi:hypothetical protein F4680DRAFT_426289 [Xylaria scruposa]|nr:hypothetical protein F4680DRAFT_426289 [Xylaria scruposa]
MEKREAITASNLGPVVSVLTWVVEAAVLIAIGIKFTLSSIIPGKRNREDFTLFLATALSIGFTISISLAVPNGIGRHQETLSLYQLESLQKAVYSADILLVLISSCVQASVLIFLHEATPNRAHRRTIHVIAGFIALLSVASFFATVFPCHPPHVWELLGVECIEQLSFWEAWAGVNIVIESALVLFPIIIIYPLRMKRRRKAVLLICFSARLIVIGTLTVQIYEAQSLKLHLHDPTFHGWKYLLITVFVQGLSIITVCIPYIRNLLLSIESGMIQTGHFRLPSRHSAEGEFPLPSLPTGKTISNLSSNADGKGEESARSHIQEHSRN